MVQDKIKQILRSYKSNQASKYIPVRGDEILTKVFDCEKYSISTKYDGHLCFIVKDKGEIYLLNFNGHPFEKEDLIQELNLILTKEGIFVGYTSGACMQAIKQLNHSKTFNEKSIIVTIFCDHGSRYMSKIYSDKWMKDQGFSFNITEEQDSQIEYIKNNG